jgi:hypothetical protein
MQATARPSPRAWRVPVAVRRPRNGMIAIASTLAVTAAVALVFVGLRPSAPRVEQPPAQRGLAVVHNHLGGALPALGGSPVCYTRLLPPRAGQSWSTPYYCSTTGSGDHPPTRRLGGSVIVNLNPPIGEVFSIDVSGLPPIPGGGDYAVWLLEGKQNPAGAYSLISGRPPAFVGIIRPPVGPAGALRAEGVIPRLSEAQATGSYLFVITRQSRPSNTSLGRIVVAGWVSI